jgi:predicted nuclease of predicted toxin-antitoxin system
VKLILDEMYPPALAEGLKAAEIDALTVADLRLTGSSDADVFGAAVASGRSVLRLIAAIQAMAHEHLEDRVVYLRQPDDR